VPSARSAMTAGAALTAGWTAGSLCLFWFVCHNCLPF
jgi:hypothetical protein